MKRNLAIAAVASLATLCSFASDYDWATAAKGAPKGYKVYFEGSPLSKSDALNAYIVYLGKDVESATISYDDIAEYVEDAESGDAYIDNSERDPTGVYDIEGYDTFFWSWMGTDHDADFEEGDTVALLLEYSRGEFSCWNLSNPVQIDADMIDEDEFYFEFDLNWNDANGEDFWTTSIVSGAGWSASEEFKEVSEVTYTVTFVHDDDAATVTTETHKFGDKLEVPGCDLPKTGWTFRRSWIDGDGKSHGTRAFISIAGDLTLTAEWYANDYAISYDLKCGEAEDGSDLVAYLKDGENPASYAITNAAITLVNPYRLGYEFTGWTESSPADVAPVLDADTPTLTATIPAGSYGERAFVSHWTKIDTDSVAVETDDVEDIKDLADYPGSCTLVFSLTEDLTESVYIPATVTNVTFKFNRHSITGSAGGAPALIFENDDVDVSFVGLASLKNGPASTLSTSSLAKNIGGTSASSASSATSALNTSPSKRSTIARGVSLGASALDGSDSVTLLGVDPVDGGWAVSFSVALKDGQDFAAWLAAARLYDRIKLHMAESLADLTSGAAEVITPSVSGCTVLGDESTRTVVFTVAPPPTSSLFFRISVD